MNLRVVLALSTMGALVAPSHAQMLKLDPGKLPSDVQIIQRDSIIRQLQEVITQIEGRNTIGSTNYSNLADRTTSDNTRRTVAAALLGRGFDIWKSEATQEKCVQASEVLLQERPASTPNKNNVYRIDKVESLQERHRQKSSGGEASLAYDIFSFGGGYSEYKGGSFKSMSRYISMYMVFVGDEFLMDNPSATSMALTRLADTGASGFAKLCGQRYISRVGFGVEFDGRLSAKIDINEETKSNQGKVDIGIKKLISASADTKNTISEMTEASNLQVSLSGATGEMPTPEDLMEYGRKFGSEAVVEDAVNQVYIETSPYSEVGEKAFREFDNVLDIITGTVLGFQDDRLKAVQQLDDLEDAEAKPEFIEVTANASAGTVKVQIKKHRDYLNQLGTMYAACRDALDQRTIEECKKAGDNMIVRPDRPTFKLLLQK